LFAGKGWQTVKMPRRKGGDHEKKRVQDERSSRSVKSKSVSATTRSGLSFPPRMQPPGVPLLDFLDENTLTLFTIRQLSEGDTASDPPDLPGSSADGGISWRN
jgi:hypothetical protein